MVGVAGYFYIIETTTEGKNYVTARGWEDLSKMIILYEKNNIKVDETLISQYIRHKQVSKEFAVYYDLYNKYKSDYQIAEIINGVVGDDIKNRAKNAKFDERISLLGLLIDSIHDNMSKVVDNDACLIEYIDTLKYIKAEITGDFSKIIEEENKEKEKYGIDNANYENEKDLLASGVDVGENNSQLKIRVKREKVDENKYKKLDYVESLNKHILDERDKLHKFSASGILKAIDSKKYNYVIKTLMYLLEEFKIENISNNDTALELIKKDYEERIALHNKSVEITKFNVENVFKFVEEVFGDGQEMVILVAEMTTRYAAAKFISTFGSDEYFKHNKEILFYERKQDLLKKIEELE